VRYFGRIHVPQEYLPLLLQDTDKLGVHQQSRKTAAEAVKNAVSREHILIAEDVQRNALPFVHEHTLSEQEEYHHYRLIDLIEVAYGSGRLSEENYRSLKRVTHKPSGQGSQHPALKRGQSVLVDLHTLYTVCQIEMEALTPILASLRVFVSKADQLRNSSEIMQVQVQEQLKSSNQELLNLVRNRNEFIKDQYSPVREMGDDDVYLASFWMAKEKKVPLLADDRVLQVLALNENNAVKCPSFGTDSLLVKLRDEQIIDTQTLTNSILTLMNWRYRFIIPTEDALLTMAKKYRTYPPGQELEDVALYVHDCMRDAGLFSGPENTTHQESMAAKLYAAWTRRVVDFLVAVWADSEFSDDVAVKLTEWAVSELSPSLPCSISSNSPHLAKVQPKVTFNVFLALTFRIDDTSRASKALQAIAESFNMGETEYFKAVSEVVDHGV